MALYHFVFLDHETGIIDAAEIQCDTDEQVIAEARNWQLLNPPSSGYRIDITQKNPSFLQKTKDVALQADIPHDFGAQ